MKKPPKIPRSSLTPSSHSLVHSVNILRDDAFVTKTSHSTPDISSSSSIASNNCAMIVTPLSTISSLTDPILPSSVPSTSASSCSSDSLHKQKIDKKKLTGKKMMFVTPPTESFPQQETSFNSSEEAKENSYHPSTVSDFKKENKSVVNVDSPFIIHQPLKTNKQSINHNGSYFTNLLTISSSSETVDNEDEDKKQKEDWQWDPSQNPLMQLASLLSDNQEPYHNSLSPSPSTGNSTS
jgi:hypothetical protein